MEEMLQAEIWTVAQTREGNAVLLHPLNENIVIPILVGQLEIQSILIGMENITLPRPLAHDLFLSLLESQGLTLDCVEIHELRENTFHARLVISGGKHTAKNPLLLDSRPSDALGLATRRKCPIMISSKIVEQIGIVVNFTQDEADFIRDNSAAESAASPLDKKRRRLQQQLDEAVEKEDYEKAAIIRDMLNGMSS